MSKITMSYVHSYKSYQKNSLILLLLATLTLVTLIGNHGVLFTTVDQAMNL